MSTKKCIVSFAAHGREHYPKAQLHLIKSCVEAGWDGDYLIRSYDGYVDRYEGVDIHLGSYPVTEKYGLCPNHAETPFGFKPAIILEAIEAGYKQIVWCDSTIFMAKDIQPLLDYAEKYGVCAFDNLGFPLLNWLTDLQQERLKITDAELFAGVQQIMACVLIFDVSNKNGKLIFDQWLKASRDGVSFQNGYGSVRRGFVATRHDQSFLSGLLYKAKIPLLPYGKLVYAENAKPPYPYGRDYFFINIGAEDNGNYSI